MPDSGQGLTVQLVPGIHAVDATAWDACAGDANPFVRHAFLAALEDSRSVGAETGWLPRHLTVEDEAGRLVAAAPAYVKTHSYGEYVFDHGWASAYERAGGRYYPKLQVAVPFTPAPGPRLLIRPDTDGQTAFRALAGGLEAAARQLGLSSVHVTFPERADWEALGAAGWLRRVGHQYHWTNRGYGSFDDFLGDLSSRKRKAIRKERREVTDSGVRLHVLTGDELKPQHWDAFYRFYIDTSDRKWGSPYLTRDFFHRIGAALADRIVLVMAEMDGSYVAGALNLRGRDALFGRNWGCHGDFRFLHFEACYYQAIDYAIAHGLSRVEAGAQGEHKIQRGYLPVETYSAHWIADPALRDAVARFLEQERKAEAQRIEMLGEWSPFRKEGGE